MDEYIEAVLREVFLPQAVKKEVRVQLEDEFLRAAELGEDTAHIRQRLGAPDEVAERYNRNYRTALHKRVRTVNAGILALVAVLVVSGVVAFLELYHYTENQLLWVRVRMYEAQTSPVGGQGGAPAGGTDTGMFGGASPQTDNRQQPSFGNAPAADSLIPARTLDTAVLTLCTCGLLLSVMGINQLSLLKSRWKGYTLYLPASRA